jgi:hypothetical protein
MNFGKFTLNAGKLTSPKADVDKIGEALKDNMKDLIPDLEKFPIDKLNKNFEDTNPFRNEKNTNRCP